MGERFSDDSETSSEENGKDSKNKKETRWVKPPLVPSSLELRREERELPPPPPPPGFLEKFLNKEQAGDNKEDDDDEEAEAEAKAGTTAEESVAEGQPETAEPAAASETEVENAAEAAPDEQTELTAAAGQETMEAAPEEEPDDSVLHIRRQPEPAPEAAPADVREEDEPYQSVAAAAAAASTATPPTPPPPSPVAPAGYPNFTPSYNWNAAPPAPSNNFNTYNNAPPQISVEQHTAEVKSAEKDAEKNGLRRGLVAGFITGYVLKAYLAGRKRERYEKATEKQIEQRDEQISRLQREQQEMADRMAARVEDYKRRQEELTHSQGTGAEKARAEALEDVPLEEQIFDQQGNRIILQPGWRVERSAGGYSVVLDEHNRVVHDAIHYGEAFKRDQRREQLSDDVFTALGGGSPTGAPPQNYGTSAPPPISRQQQPQTPAGDLSGQHPTADLRRRLPESRSPLASAFGSPWLWTAVAILVIVYFIAALA